MEGGIRHHDSHDDCNMPMELDTVELERKLLVHVLSKRLTKVERYGLLAGHGKADAWRPRERARGHAEPSGTITPGINENAHARQATNHERDDGAQALAPGEGLRMSARSPMAQSLLYNLG